MLQFGDAEAAAQRYSRFKTYLLMETDARKREFKHASKNVRLKTYVKSHTQQRHPSMCKQSIGLQSLYGTFENIYFEFLEIRR